MSTDSLIQGLAKSLVIQKSTSEDIQQNISAPSHEDSMVVLGLPDYSMDHQVIMSRILTAMNYAQNIGMPISAQAIKDYFKRVHDASVEIKENTGVAADAIRSSLYKHPERFYGAPEDEVRAFIDVYSSSIRELTSLTVSEISSSEYDGSMDMVYFLSQGHEKEHPSGEVMSNFNNLVELRGLIAAGADKIKAVSGDVLNAILASPKGGVLDNIVRRVYKDTGEGLPDVEAFELKKALFVNDFMFSKDPSFIDNLSLTLAMYSNELGKSIMLAIEPDNEHEVSMLGASAFSSIFRQSINQSLGRIQDAYDMESLRAMYVNFFIQFINEEKKQAQSAKVKLIPAEKSFLVHYVGKDIQSTVALMGEAMNMRALREFDTFKALTDAQSKQVSISDNDPSKTPEFK